MAFWHQNRHVRRIGVMTTRAPALHAIKCLDLLQLLLVEFSDIFDTPSSLPSVRASEPFEVVHG
jgi:hypothetical protein